MARSVHPFVQYANDFDQVVQDAVVDQMVLDQTRANSGTQIISRGAKLRMISDRSKTAQQFRAVRVPLPFSPLLLGVQQDVA